MFRSAAGFASIIFLLSMPAIAQDRIDAFFAMGTVRADSNDLLLDFLGNGVPQRTPSMGGVFGTVGGGLMLTPSLGVGAQVCFRFDQGEYANIGYRPVFYDFNGIWTPSIGSETIMPELQAGFGGVSLRFYGGTQYFDYNTGTYSNFLGSSNHLQLHTGIGLRFYVKENIFLRPQFDYRWVSNLDEFGENSVLGFSVAIGFSSHMR
jgi:hypothetical protein